MALRWTDLPFRMKILVVLLSTVILGGLFVLLIGTRLEHRTILSLAETRVRHNLVSAHEIYDLFLENMTAAVSAAAEHDVFRRPAGDSPNPAPGRILERTARIGRLDFCSFSDSEGRVIARSDPAAPVGDRRAADSFFRRVLAGESISATRRLSAESLRKESRRLAEAGSGSMIVLVTGIPVRGEDGRISGLLYGGRRINGDNEIVDRIKASVFETRPDGTGGEGDVSIYQDDVRAATTLADSNGVRAIGTKGDPDLLRNALRKNLPWAGRARVFGEGFISAAEPLLDHENKPVGMLILGLRERPYLALRNSVMAKFALLGICAVAVLLLLLVRLTGRLVRPLKDVAAAAARVAQGDLNLQVDEHSRDEIGELGASFNRMTAELRKTKENLLQWTWTLEGRVVERNRALREIQDSMARSEKMASLGQLSAGIAHEINNPLTAILLNAHLLLEKAGPNDPNAAALHLIAEETERCAEIVKGLLDYSRRTPPEKTAVNLNVLIDRTVGLLSGQAWARNIRITRNLDRSLPPFFMDGTKIQQVFWNLILNACEAMPGGGGLDIASRRSADGRSVEIAFADSGPGVPEDIIGRIFDPFFTTKPSGTGLGLAVAGGIVEQHGGTISVRNEAGRGAVFTIQWPLPQAEKENKGTGS